MNRGHLSSTLSLFAVTTALAVGYCRVFEGWSWLIDLVVVAVVTHSIAFLANRRPLPVALAALVTAAAGAWTIALLRLRTTLWFGLPTARTWNTVTDMIGDSWSLVGNVTPPLAFDTGFGIAALGSIVFVALVSDAFAFRAAGRTEALIPSILVFVVVAAVGEDHLRVLATVVWILATLNAVTVLRRRESTASPTRGHSAWSAVLGASMAIVCAVAAGLVTPMLPGANSEALLSNKDGGQQIVDPMVDVRGRLLDRSDTVLFTVKADMPSYWRLTALPSFDGTKWGIPRSELDAAGGELAPLRESMSGDIIRTSYQRYDIEGLAGNLLPATFEPFQLRASTRSLFYALDPGALVVTGDGLLSTDSYEIVSMLIEPTTRNLESATVARPPDSEYLKVPDTNEMSQLTELAISLTTGATSPYQQALMLQNWFRTEFTYSLDVPAGTGADATLDFIAARAGYCEQFSSTMALLARLIGIPSRVAIGFTPGDASPDGTYVVRSQHAHAWPELWFDGIGWVLFEPTPGRGAPNTSYTGVEPAQDESAPVTTTVAPTTTPAPSTTIPDGQATTTVASTSADPSNSGGGPSTWLWLFIVLGIWISMMPSVVRRLASDESDPLLLAWRRMLAVYAASGASFGSDATPHEIANSLTPKPGLDETVVRDLGDAVTSHIYSSTFDSSSAEGAELIERAREWTRGASKRLSLAQRVRLRVDPTFVWRMNR